MASRMCIVHTAIAAALTLRVESSCAFHFIIICSDEKSWARTTKKHLLELNFMLVVVMVATGDGGRGALVLCNRYTFCCKI